MPNKLKIHEDEDEDNGVPMALEPDTELWELMERAVVALESMAAGMHDQQNSVSIALVITHALLTYEVQFGKVIEAALESLDKWAEYKAEVHRLEAERLQFYIKVGSLLE